MTMPVTLTLDQGAGDVLMPMHLRISESGHIRHAGPTLQKLRPGLDLVGQRFLEVFEMKRPRNVKSMAEIRQFGRSRLHLHFRAPPETAFKAVLVEDGAECLVNLSFGISIVDAIRDYNLHSSDFAPTDLAVEMLYLLEAKSSIMEESRSLNQRLQAARIAAEEQAYTDTLTGLKNRRALNHVLDRYAASSRPFGLIHLDLDFFKAVNDTLGHAAGDHVLQVVARIMIEETRGTDTLVRSGGDEFLLVLPDMTQPEHLMKLSERLISKIETPILFNAEECKISASAGIAVEDGDYLCTTSELISRSDRALYASKHRGKACATLYTPKMKATAKL